MKTTVWMKRSAIAAVAAIAVLSSVSWSDEVPHYGRAGGAVGADRIKELHSVQRAYHAMPEQPPVLIRYGRAGGPVGAQAVPGDSTLHELNVVEPIRIPNVYGRAGVPLPFQN
jgi:hypothetical protein